MGLSPTGLVSLKERDTGDAYPQEKRPREHTREAPGGTNPDGTLEPPGLGENRFMLFKPPSLWHFVKSDELSHHTRPSSAG